MTYRIHWRPCGIWWTGKLWFGWSRVSAATRCLHMGPVVIGFVAVVA